MNRKNLENKKRNTIAKYGMRKLSIGFVACLLGFATIFTPMASTTKTVVFAGEETVTDKQGESVSEAKKIETSEELKEYFAKAAKESLGKIKAPVSIIKYEYVEAEKTAKIVVLDGETKPHEVRGTGIIVQIKDLLRTGGLKKFKIGNNGNEVQDIEQINDGELLTIISANLASALELESFDKLGQTVGKIITITVKLEKDGITAEDTYKIKFIDKKTAEEELKVAKETKKEEIEKIALTEEEKAEKTENSIKAAETKLTELKAAAVKAIEAAETKEAVNEVKVDKKAALDLLKTEAEELQAEKDAAKAKIEAIALTVSEKAGKTSDSIKEAEAKLAELKAAAVKAIEAAETKEAVNDVTVDKQEAVNLLISAVNPNFKLPTIDSNKDTTKTKETIKSEVKKSTGWVLENGSWKYANKDGKEVKTSWLYDDNKWYYLEEDGQMSSDEWVKVGDAWYWANSSGRISQSEWVYVNGSWFWTTDSGRISENEWVFVDGTWYYAEDGGYIVMNQWKEINGKWYYFNQSGALLVNTTTPDGYRVNANGEWI